MDVMFKMVNLLSKISELIIMNLMMNIINVGNNDSDVQNDELDAENNKFEQIQKKFIFARVNKMSTKRSPGDFLRQVLRRAVIVRLTNGVEFKGVLACLDDRLNIAMEQTEEYVEGKLVQKYGDTFIRGNNVLYIVAAATKRHAPDKSDQKADSISV
eukprot:GHVP01068541.1.p1 GENE.GHVP01068541.1~~GHVP01068541.1.p1  ORF type:complete len:157 (+),score=31.65 GHVP01068541.1:32-502(+)